MYPFILQNIILPIADTLSNQGFNKELKLLRKQVKLSETELEYLQKQKLMNLLKHASNHSPFYKKRFNLNEDLDAFDLLKQVPVLEKKEIRIHSDEIITFDINKLLKNSSSGSSGYQTTVYWNHREQAINRATQMLWWEWAGYKLGNPLVQTGINPHRPGIKKLKDIIFRTNYIQAFSHSEEDILKCLKKVTKEYTLAGYASSLYVFASIAKKNNLNVKFKNAVCWGDKLFDHYRKEINEVFGCKINETYGSAEGLMMAAQKDLDFMYIMTPNVVVEILDDNGNEVKDGEMGNVVVTNLNAYAMPLIRYRIGDLAIKLPKENYPLKRELNLPLLQKVVGRDTDLIKTQSGKYLVVHSFTGIFEHVPEIEQFCIIQNVLSSITIQYVPAKNFTENCLQFVEEKILENLKENLEIKFQKVEHIEPSKSGKPQIIISNLK